MTGKEKQKAIDALKISVPIMAMTREEFNDYTQTLNKIMDWLEQEPKTGHWVTSIKSDRRDDYWPTNPKCSECGGEPYYNNTIYNYKFCPFCGARMESEEE